MSDSSLAGSTATPSASPLTAARTEMVRSRSLPVTRELVAGQLEAEPGQDGQRTPRGW